MLTLLLPVTRSWTLPAVIEALAASDIPRERCVLVLDAPGCALWETSLYDLGFRVELHITRNPPPTTDRYERRRRHIRMREFTLPLVGDGPLLTLDDDTIVPPDVYARLSRAGEHATGVQVSRWGSRRCGVYRGGRSLRAQASGVESIDYCGHYCLLTTGEMYRQTAVHLPSECYMKPIPNLVVDWGCVCGHMTKDGVLWP